MQKPPSLRIAVTEKCNLKCLYCPKSGDSYSLVGKTLGLEDFKKIVKAAYEEGIKFFSITGGEPLIVPEITFPLVKYIKSLGNDDGYLRLNTNGVLIEKYIEEIGRADFDKVKVSIDTFDIENYCFISGNPLRDNLEKAIRGISEIKKFTEVRVHSVIGKYNIKEINEIINLCIKNGLDLKLFDIMNFPNKNVQDREFWQKNYVALGEIAQYLEKTFGKPKIINSPGGYGQPKKVFTTPGGTKIRVQDTEADAHYSDICRKCSEYMCQQGLCNLTLSADGRLKICHPIDQDLGLSLVKGEKLKSEVEMKVALKKPLIFLLIQRQFIVVFLNLVVTK
ncbi:MAG: Molybdenum cofactor biosynthesis protein A [candidate division CPR2 bacterium GW2011_GWC1_41_48]|uniref:Molybdenum cofactor biosynthesis protein A n=1 Tax=candidate division CPR2 bacterium GW2011_GWC1_41_48 TaxID=1618344 RepID=A0A0G0W772_UNCC2|nr:MAG: Molybdenum cofactor biosynthesis protein A [candidate division CPR2 bacterium GW2011_GWC2_39_35]KKR28652.1 MAG: Molybdenum cofactor biosynthesis protein A [candidate division CPR2 bacterium GW2011_GWD2_39_7]KKR28790.1 MAG: Molybdenum cofactor biosynthesis protein A [candidate division CPR2 bacterium GW2011_GWD1_39_7]KKS08815.1 MAG: Molybdenum cofactor biosynthesis protein A [candidate division CPR2 bacterium GW2011_GWC1_41_48]